MLNISCDDPPGFDICLSFNELGPLARSFIVAKCHMRVVHLRPVPFA